MAPRLPRFFFWIVVAIILSTVLIRIHYALDIVFGLLVSELVVRLVFQPIHHARTLEKFPGKTAWTGSCGLLLAGFTSYVWLAGA
jgi:membrane-associated phospholipid phosphatase